MNIWGTGVPYREFLYVDDLADACLYLMEQHDAGAIGEFINIGTGEDIRISDLVELVRTVVGYRLLPTVGVFMNNNGAMNNIVHFLEKSRKAHE